MNYALYAKHYTLAIHYTLHTLHTLHRLHTLHTLHTLIGNFEELSEEEAAKEVFNELAVMMGGELKLPLQDFLQWEDVQVLTIYPIYSIYSIMYSRIQHAGELLLSFPVRRHIFSYHFPLFFLSKNHLFPRHLFLTNPPTVCA